MSLDDTVQHQLVLAAQEGDQQALANILKRYEPDVKATVYHMLGLTDDGDDVIQDALLAVCESLKKFNHQAALKTFIIRITMNVAIDQLRKQQRQRRRFFSFLSPKDLETQQESVAAIHHDSCAALNMADKQRDIHQALMQLSSDHRSVISLRYIQEFSTEETANILGIRSGTVLSRLSRAKEQLKILLEKKLETIHET